MVKFAEIEEAQNRISHIVKHTNLEYSDFFSQISGHQVYFKTENLQYTNSFKPRGASNFVLQLDPDIAARGVIASSSGNHGQGVAYIASKMRYPCVIVVPKGAIEAKVQAIKSFGAEVIYCGTSSEERRKKARELSEERKMIFIHGFDDPKVIAGQGTIGLEILEDFPEVEVILAPIGGGGLISGILSAVKEKRPDIKVYGVEPSESNCMYVSLHEGKITKLLKTSTIADGLRSNRPGNLTFPIVKEYIDDIILVCEEDILKATKNLLLKAKLLVEPSGAVTSAALISKKIPGKNKKVVPIISGGNVDLKFIKKLLD